MSAGPRRPWSQDAGDCRSMLDEEKHQDGDGNPKNHADDFRQPVFATNLAERGEINQQPPLD